jgi:putative hydrolase of the HAD superfamily
MFGYIPPVARVPATRPRPASRLMPRFSGCLLDAGVASHVRRSRRGILIDLDDTLYPRERFVRSGLAAVAHHVSLHYDVAADAAYAVMTRASAAGCTGSEMQALCDRFGLSRNIVPTLVNVFRTHAPTLFLGPDAVDALERLRGDGWALAIVTNGLPSVQFRKVAALGLARLVDEVIYAEEHAPGGKPLAGAFTAALRGLDLVAGQCVCVGDDPVRDIAGARALGMATIRLARPGIHVGPADEADAVIDSVRQLPDAASLLMSAVTADVA